MVLVIELDYRLNILVKARGSSGIVTIGKANVSAGIVTSVTITNGGGSGFSSATPPVLEFVKTT